MTYLNPLAAAGRLLVATAGLGLAVAASPAAAAGALDSQEAAVLQQRFESLRDRTMTRYDPGEVARGAPRALPKGKSSAIAPAALKAADEYARANNSTALLVWHGGAVAHAAYFGPARAATPLVSRSLSKPLGVIMIGRAIALGHIRSLDQPVSDFIPQWRDGPRSKILIRHLLDMRTGLMPQGPSPTADHILNRAYLSPRHGEVLIDDYPLVSEPGQRFDYSNANADLVAIVIEKATGRRFADFMSDAVLKPIGAADVSVWLNRPGGLAHAGCCMMTPADTWLRLGVLLLQDGVWDQRRLLPPGYVAEMRRGTAQNPRYGLGVYAGAPYVKWRGFNAPDQPGQKILHSEPYVADDLFLFDGNADQVVYIVPSAGLVVVRTGDNPPASPGWDNAFLANVILRGLGRP